jgi:hypothetical protein
MSNPEKFTAIKVEWDYMMLNQIGSPSPTRVKTNPKKVTARCEACGIVFTADAGRQLGAGKFVQTVSGPGYQCQCGNAGTIDINDFS